MAFEAPFALVDARVTLLEAAPTDLRHDDGQAAFAFADNRLVGDTLHCFAKNVKIAGKVKTEGFEFLGPPAKEALNNQAQAQAQAPLNLRHAHRHSVPAPALPPPP